MELKDMTLEDLPLDTYNDVPVHILKQWAIANVKELKYIIDTGDFSKHQLGGRFDTKYGRNEAKMIIYWIMEKFNLKEEDFK